MPNAILDCRHERAYFYWDAFYGKKIWECPVCLKTMGSGKYLKIGR